jgi:octaprenyl-diphosphate synthase
VLYSKGFHALNTLGVPVAQTISNAVVQLSLGELQDVELSRSFNTDKARYLHMIYQKTASLMEASAGAAALIAGKEKDAYMTYGRNLGIAFQMIDDLLDITADSETLGKPALHDFEEGKTTLPYIYLYEALDSESREKLRAMHGKKLLPFEQQWIKEKMQEHDVITKSFREAKALVEEAITLMNAKGEEALSAIAMAMIEREF